jgi:hypothetical protein
MAPDARPERARALTGQGMASSGWRRPWVHNIAAAGVAAGVVAAITVAASASAPSKLPGPRRAAMPGGCTERATLTAPDGRITGCVSYRYGRHGLRIRGVAASFAASVGFDDPNFTFTFRNQATGAIRYQFSTPPVAANAVRRHSTGPILLSARPAVRAVHRGDDLEITLKYEAPDGSVDAVATLSLSLNPHGLLCPALGNNPESSDGVPIC